MIYYTTTKITKQRITGNSNKDGKIKKKIELAKLFVTK